MTVTWRDDSGTDLGSDRVSLSSLTSTWQRVTARVVAPGGTTRVWVELTGSAGNPGDHLYLDDLVIAGTTG